MKNFLVISFILMISFFTKAQYLENNPTWKERIFFGGDIGMNFGTNTVLSLNPVVGYRLTNRFSIGSGINYFYYKMRYYYISEGSALGYNAFLGYTVIKDIQEILPFLAKGTGLLILTELNMMNVRKIYVPPFDNPVWNYSPMAGFAIQIPSGGAKRVSYMVISAMYNFNENYYSLYTNPVIRISFWF